MHALLRLLAAAAIALTLSGCITSRPIQSFAQNHPQQYFTGHTTSWGEFETRSGAPWKDLRTETWGHMSNAALHFEQDLYIGQGAKQHRSWLIQRTDPHHYTATGTGIIGTAHGVAYGNVFHLQFTLDTTPGNPLARVHMSQWMYLQPDGVTLINRDTLTKWDFTIVEITEQFRKQ
jgi:hypothetical protein